MNSGGNDNYYKAGMIAAAVVAFGLIFYFLLYRSGTVFSAIGAVLGILRPFLYGSAMAYLMVPLSRMFEKKLPHTIADIAALLVAVLIVLAIILLIVPHLVSSVAAIIDSLPAQLEALQDLVKKALENSPDVQADWEEASTNIMNSIEKFLKQATGGDAGTLIMKLFTGAASHVFNLFGVIKDLFLGLIVALYILSARARLAAQAGLILRGSVKPSWADWIESEVRYADRMFNGFFVGKLLDSAIIGLICFACCLLMGFESPLLIAVIIGVTNIIPFFGPFIGAIPCALLLLLENPVHCLMFIVFIIILQQIDGNIIGPKILGDSTGLSPLWVMFAILLFGGLWGLLGMIVGVPLMAVIYDIVRQCTYRGVKRHGRESMIIEYNAVFHPADEQKKKRRTKKADKNTTQS